MALTVSAEPYAVSLLSGCWKFRSLARHFDPHSVESLVQDPKHMAVQAATGKRERLLGSQQRQRWRLRYCGFHSFLKKVCVSRMYPNEEVILYRLLEYMMLY